jgi:hypothetical protein
MASRLARSLLASLVLGVVCRPVPAPTAAPAPAPAPAAAPTALPSFPSDDAIVRELVALARTDSRVEEHLRHLTLAIGARLTSSHALMTAEAWCKDRFTEWGLDARLERWGEFPVGFDRGPWSAAVVGASGDLARLEITTPAWTPGVLGPIEGPVVSYPETVAAAKALGKGLHGAFVLRPEWRTGGPAPRVLEKIQAVLRAAGVAAVVVRAGGEAGELVHTSGRHEIDWAKLPTDVEIRLRGSQWDAIAEQVRAGSAPRLRVSIDNRFFRGPVPLHNVVADLRGSEKPDEYVIVGGHLDSWDGAQGAVDNGTGVATTLEAARLLAAVGAAPKRTIRFMLWSGEEQGLLGSKAWVEAHADETEKISAVFVHDGGTNYLSGLRIPPEMRAQLEPALEPVTRLDEQLPFALTDAEGLLPGGSDHSPFIAAGVPGFFWEQAGKSDYDHMHHTQFDTFETAVPEYQRHSALVVAITAWRVANLDERLDRTNSAPLPRRRLAAELTELEIRSVDKKGPARAAGLRVGDVVLACDGAPLENRRDLMRMLQDGGPEKTLHVRRGTTELDVVVDWSTDPGEAERERRRAERLQRFGPAKGP